MIRVLRLAFVTLAAFAQLAAAHEMTMAELALRATTPDDFLWQWAASEKPPEAQLVPVWPEHCSAADSLLRCGSEGLAGTLAVDGIGNDFSAVLVKIYWFDGRSSVLTLTAAQPSARVYGGADDTRGLGEIARAYGVLGVEHILSGFDHLLFVIALLFLVGFNRRLLYTITAFTVAHSLTLASSALGLLTLRSPPVEATIALSIVLVAAEALNERPTLARRWPALVAFGFGLVHGLGFAGALRDIGLPDNHLPAALLTFNLGVELGQLLVVGAAYLVYRHVAARPRRNAARVPVLYAVGAVAAYWSIGRVLTLAG